MAIITQFPRGLVSLTGLRDMGEAPRQLADVIAPSIDVTQFLLLNREAIYGSVSAAAIGSFVATGNPHLVPAGELWYVHSWSVSATVFAGDTGRIAPQVNFLGQQIVNGRPSTDQAVLAVNTAISCFTESPFWAGPGSELGCLVERWSGAAGLGLGMRAIISRLRI